MLELRYGWMLLVATVALGGCGDQIYAPEAVQDRVALQSFNNCAELEQYIENTAVLDMRAQISASRDGYGGRGWFGLEDGMAAPQAAGSAEKSTSAGPSAYTKTNTQVAGVDEADFVKNDGTRILVLSGNKLYLTQSWPADQLSIASKLEIEGWPREMFLDEKNHVVVFSNVYTRYESAVADGAPAKCSGAYCGYYYANTAKMTVVDITDLSAPRVVREEYLPGRYENSRRIGSAVRVVLNDAFRWPAEVRFWPDYSADLYQNKSAMAAAFDKLIPENERIIREQTLSNWLPPARRKLADGSIVDVPYECSDFHRPTAATKLGLVTVATLNLDNESAPVARTSIVAESGEIYASPTSLYIANRHWWWWPQPGQKDHTYLHKFDITQPDRAVYVASGGADGHIVDQFSMDEYDGYFRIATTIATRVPELFNRWGRVETTNRVSVLRENAGALEVIGQTPDLAQGERLYSSRFIGDKGFIVTFRQVDPLFSLDLTDPTNPTVVGELKVPGFSSYLHPIDKDHLLAIGTYLPEPDASGRTDWRQRALKLTVFDVGDLANPREELGVLVGTSGAYSEAQYEHKAFNWFPEKKLLAIPFYDWNSSISGSNYWYSFVSELRVFRVETGVGITPLGAVSLADIYRSANYNGWTYYWSPWVRRSVMADDFVYAVSDGGIRSAHISNLSLPLKTVVFDRYVER